MKSIKYEGIKLLRAALFMLYQMQGHQPHLTESSQRSDVRRYIDVIRRYIQELRGAKITFLIDNSELLNTYFQILVLHFIYALSNATSAESS